MANSRVDPGLELEKREKLHSTSLDGVAVRPLPCGRHDYECMDISRSRYPCKNFRYESRSPASSSAIGPVHRELDQLDMNNLKMAFINDDGNLPPVWKGCHLFGTTVARTADYWRLQGFEALRGRAHHRWHATQR